MITPSITSRVSLNHQYGLMSWCRWSFLPGQPVIIKPFNHCRCSAYTVACWIWCMDIHSGTLVIICTTSTFMSIPCIASSLFFQWLWWDSQFAIKISGPHLYKIWTLYWWIFRSIHWIHCDRVAASLLKWSLVVYDQWLHLHPLQNNSDGIFLSLCSMPSASLSILLFLCSVLVKLLLANAMGQSIVLSSTMFFLACCSCLCLQKGRPKAYSRCICLKIKRFTIIIKFHAYISLY